MRRPILLALLALLVLPGASFAAAKAKISPNPETVSAAGVVSIEAANPTSRALRGKATIAAAGRTIASKTVRLPKRSVAEIRLRLGAKALAALRSAGSQRVTVKLRLRRSGGAFKTATRKLTLRAASGAAGAGGGAKSPTPVSPSGQMPGSSNGPNGQSGSTPPPPPPPPSNRWVGRMGTEGPYDDLAFTLEGGKITLTKSPLVLTSCLESGASNGLRTSYEPFVVAGPWTLGGNELVSQMGIASNPLVGSGERTINYRVRDTVEQPGKVTGVLSMSYFDSRLVPMPYPTPWKSVYVNCAGTQGFEAVPAP